MTRDGEPSMLSQPHGLVYPQEFDLGQRKTCCHVQHQLQLIWYGAPRRTVARVVVAYANNNVAAGDLSCGNIPTPLGRLSPVFGGHVSTAAATVAPCRDVHHLARYAMGSASLSGMGGEIEGDLAQLFRRQLTWRANNLAAYHDYVDDTIIFGDRVAYLEYVVDIVVVLSGN